MKRALISFGMLICMMSSYQVYADVTTNLKMVTDNKKDVGTITATDTKYGLLLTPNFTGLPPGSHGFHIHEKPSCENGGMAAGGHLDPQKTNLHLGPYNAKGHLGDLPVLYVDVHGNATTPILAPRLSTQKILNHAIMIHTGSDNYSDTPPMGGGGSRLACGVLPLK